MAIFFNGLRNILIVLLVFIFFGCDAVVKEEIKRISSPDSTVDAVLIRTNAGATASYGYLLYIVPKDKTPENGKEILRADKIKEIQIKWQAIKRLEVKYKKGRIFHFTNFWESKNVLNFKYIVNIKLTQI